MAVKSISSFTGLLSLRERDTHSLDLEEGERCHLLVGTGVAWITMEGNPDDFGVTADTPRIDFCGPGRLVIEAVGTGLAIQVTRTGRTN